MMQPDEMIEILKANIDKTVRVTYQDGDTDLALVLTVDDEGFVFDLASLRSGEQNTSYWARFSDLTEVRPASSLEDSK
jgi:hypothetical protein